MKAYLYRDFLHASDQKFSTIKHRHSDSFSCRKGCHACCLPDRTVLKIEAAHIVDYLLKHPERIEELKALEENDPHNGTRCSFLTAEGSCGIYPVRPFICRSHGAPIAIFQGEYYQADVCPLNFTQRPIEQLGPEDFFILDQWNDELLNLAPDEDRIALRLSVLLKGT